MKLIKRVSQNVDLTQAQREIKLIPLAMVVPNEEGVYSLSQYGSPLTITESEWRTYTPAQIKVGTPENWHWATAYIKALSGWYIAVEASK